MTADREIKWRVHEVVESVMNDSPDKKCESDPLWGAFKLEIAIVPLE